MSSLTLQLEGDALREAISQSILGVLTPETKAALLDQAVQAILAPSTNSWDKKKSPLELAFERAVDAAAQQEAVRLISEDQEMLGRIQDLLRATADKVLAADVDKMAERMADAFVASMKRDY